MDVSEPGRDTRRFQNLVNHMCCRGEFALHDCLHAPKRVVPNNERLLVRNYEKTMARRTNYRVQQRNARFKSLTTLAGAVDKILHTRLARVKGNSCPHALLTHFGYRRMGRMQKG